ncbi:sugar metabolism global transcriptional regulator Mlc [Xenorhabdus bovienii]|uniref:sugar metabolism global transcriptional regulator Mlc n=1 Tax=Xenorhabdus bovienii TaxID=40576 RepID=UPI0023B2272B|nr:ROK family protein [Xenorhabdus bovienii]MDE9431804.1 ROK family protein [Xenorhabdus bovienii]MDE9489530.1 ROK family protein [Xenorhabdus bovienii]MDE9505779.1 ROK family protein [Xenorhabdus bovienii]MDE9545908.1 ROK family protein [Xenorhabdus bovienii]
MSVDIQPSHIDQIKQTNIGLVYRLIDQYGPISRIALSKKSQLAPASITKITRELIDSHLVKEAEFPDLSFRGRPAVGLKIDSKGWQFLCIRINKESVVFGLRDLSNNLRVEEELPFSFSLNQSFLDCIVDEIDDFFFRHQSCLERLTAISITTNAIIDPNNGIIHSSPYYDIQDIPLGTFLHQRTGLPTFLQHGITAWTIAESLYGAGENCQNIIQIVIDDNVGAGVMTAGQMLHAGNHSVVEIGHTQVDPDGEHCYCGNTGCLETVVGIKNILVKAHRLAESHPDSLLYSISPLTIDSLCQAANQGDLLATNIIHDVGERIGRITAIMVNIFNPEKILIGSPLNGAQNILYPAIQQQIAQLSLPGYSKQVNIVATRFDNTGTLPAASLIKQSLYSGELLIELMQG